jgi:ABC-type polysaccharide/polyol phosphate transport system ATPase subunit
MCRSVPVSASSAARRRQTTLLKLIARHVADERHGAVGDMWVSLIELGAGFHPELTGRENVYLGAGLLAFDEKKSTGSSTPSSTSLTSSG